jgi:hypothetical protein
MHDFLFPVRTACPPGACTCNRDALLEDPNADIRLLRLTREEEKKLVERIENITSYKDLLHVQERINSQLGIALEIMPGAREVKTVRGLSIRLLEQPGLCKKLRQSIPAAVRRCLDNNPAIAFSILNAHDLLG